MVCVLMKILSYARAKNKRKRLKAFKLISHFYWSFSSDNMAVKRLKGNQSKDAAS